MQLLTILLDSDRTSTISNNDRSFRTYTSNDIVSGRVIFKGKPDSVLPSSLVFSGQLDVAVIDHSTVGTQRQTSTIFNIPFPLEPKHLMPNGRWLFEFRVPETVNLTLDGTSGPRHVPSLPQPLLPSFEQGNPNSMRSSLASATVEY